MIERPAADLRRAVYRPVRGGNALEDTVARLVQTVRLGLVAPGESLPPERELAERYAVSRDTVRQAIGELADAGYLVRRRGRYGGTFVADPLPQPAAPEPIDAAEFADVLGMRRVLEVGAARAAAARRLSDAERGRLLDRQAATVGAGPDGYRRADTLLHLTLVQLSGIPSLLPLVVENRARVNVWLDRFPLLPRNIEHSDVQHDRIIEAVLEGRPDAAAAAVLDHLAGSEALLRGFLA